MREIAFDTETTGLDWSGEDRIIELGAVELINHIPTGEVFRVLINPGRPVSADTIRITGITDDMLADKPAFADPQIVDAFLDFVGDSGIVAHNAAFDRNFLNAELARCDLPAIEEPRWVDTLDMARKKFPGAPASLDALCKRFDVSLEARAFHGALLDAQLLAMVYLELLGGRARAFDFDPVERQSQGGGFAQAQQRPAPRAALITADERRAHDAFVAGLGDGALWAEVKARS